ncbi:MAG: nucleotide sugar dehydrogenase [Ammonifex sp.]|nr:MAG: nucleotide sugar dehydrogenase [Ammonifex sp.]
MAEGYFNEVAVFGLGFVGLPLSLCFTLANCRVVGVDVDAGLVQEINNGVTYHHEQYRGFPIQEILRQELARGSFRATTDAREALGRAQDIVVTVGLPVIGGEPDTGPLTGCLRSIAAGLKPGDLVLVRSTLVPGMMRRLVKPLLEESGLTAGRDFYLGYAPERIAEGRAFEEFVTMPVVVSGIDELSRNEAAALLRIITRAETLPASSFEAAEVAKLIENISRDVGIALVNELSALTGTMGINTFEVVRLANSHKRVKLLQPGPGVGGYCLPNAFHYLAPVAREAGIDLELMAAARRVNDAMPRRVADAVLRLLPVPPAAARVAVLGLAMKDFSSDSRQSPALKVVAHLQEAGLAIRAFDPLVPDVYPFQVGSLEKALDGAHGAVVLARQQGFEPENVEAFARFLDPSAPFIVDTKNIYANLKIVPAGLRVVFI